MTMLNSIDGAHRDSDSQILWEDGELTFRRSTRLFENGQQRSVLIARPATEHPPRASLDRLSHQYALKDILDNAWALRPLCVERDGAGIAIVFEDTDCEPLDAALGAPMQIDRFLEVAIAIAAAVGKVHRAGLVHKDIKPANILIGRESQGIQLTGFGIASRWGRERLALHPPETIAGSLAYMAPEQTGRMNRSVDSRSDLYALGITFYQMLTGVLPFAARDATEWVHCHIARRPVAPAERLGTVPGPVSAIVMKLLAKRAEDRYQTAAGIEFDLRHCRTEWLARGGIAEFPLGSRDAGDRLLVPEKLYGRTCEVKTLLESYDRVVNGGGPELVLVSGYSGIGKSSIVNELQPTLVSSGGLFASGKFDQYQRDVPYSTLAQALRSLTRSVLRKSEADLAPWRDALREALGPHARLIVDLVPEVQLVIGESPIVPEVSPQDAQRRFQRVLRQFIGVFARSEHPLALFLDDLQWLDPATLDLLEDLLSRSDLPHLLLIGAYRDNEVTNSHPLARRLESIRTTCKVQNISLGPLTDDDLTAFIAESLGSDRAQVAELVRLVRTKTGGNPFFVIQFLYVLADEQLLVFDQQRAVWSWDVDSILAKRHTDNVVDLLAGRLTKLPLSTQDALRQLACLGNSADVSMLSIVLGVQEEAVHQVLWEARQQQLIERRDGSYKFVHDRVQEAAYKLIPQTALAGMHLRIGRLLARHTSPEKLDKAIFEIVNHHNRGATLIDARDERDRVAELNLIAGKRAKSSTAYLSALHYLVSGTMLLEDGWARRPKLMFDLELQRAECEFLTGDYEIADERLMALAARADNTIDRATVACLHSDVYTTLDRSDRALDICLDYLRLLGVSWSPHPTEAEVWREHERSWSLIGRREIEDLIDLPLMSDPQAEATMEVLTKAITPALFTDSNLFSLVLWRMVSLSLEFGNCESSCQAYAHMTLCAGFSFGDYEAGFRFGRLGYDLLERRGFKRLSARTHLAYAHGVVSATAGPRAARDLIRRTFDTANSAGDLTYAAFSCHHLVVNLLLAGDCLIDAQREAERGLEFAQKARFGLEIDVMATHLAHIRSLRGLTISFGSLNDANFDELQIERRLSSDTKLKWAEARYWWQKLQTRYLSGDHASAVEASFLYQRLSTAFPKAIETPEAHFYGALSHAASYSAATDAEQARHFAALTNHREGLLVWVRHCPAALQSRVALVEAEIARIESRELDAERLYEAAIESARANELAQNQAIAYECAARFYASRGLKTIAKAYLREARSCYLYWGAEGKVRQLEALYPFLRDLDATRTAAATIAAPLDDLDFATLFKASRVVSGEPTHNRLIDALMRLAIEHAGAERGLLLLLRGDRLQGETEAITAVDGIIIRRDDGASAGLPDSVVHYVMRSREIVVIADASADPAYSSEPYFRERRARSVLCLPLVSESNIVGVLYLENNLAPYVFTPERVTVLKVLASQAGISLENSQLYLDLARRERRFRRLVDANILGVCIWNLAGAIIEANQAFLDLLQYQRVDVSSGRLSWIELTPPEWRAQDDRVITQLRASRSLQPFEKEFFRRDGSRICVLLGCALLEDSGEEGVAFVLDLTERKRAEGALRESEARFRDYAETASDWFWEIGHDYRFTLLTENAFGSDGARRVGSFCWDHALDFKTEPEKWQLIKSRLDSRQPFRDFVYCSTDGRGAPIYVNASGRPVFDSSGTFCGYRGTGSDVTAKVRAKEAEEALNVARAELGHAAQMMSLGALTASIAHEVNQPLAGIITNASTCLSMLDLDPPNMEVARLTAKRALRDGSRAADIVKRLREMFAHKEPTVERLALNDTAREVLALTSAELRRRRVTLVADFPADLPGIVGNRVQLQQVILNLVLNAADAMNSIEDRSRELRVTTAYDGGQVYLSVRDSGIGIDPQKLEKVFEAFYTTKSDGMGVGLSISRSIITGHKGRLWATNNEGRGATFAFSIPAAR